MVDKQQEIFKKWKDLFLPHGFKSKLLEDLQKKYFFLRFRRYWNSWLSSLQKELPKAQVLKIVVFLGYFA